MILTGVDTNHEDLLPWWLNNALKHNRSESIGVWDFGMSSTMRERIQKEYPDVWLSIDASKFFRPTR